MHATGVGFFVGAGIPKGRPLTALEVENLDHGDRVFWNDPDEGQCSREYQIDRIEHCGDMVRITEPDGSELQCFGSELSTVVERVNKFVECGCCGAYHRADFHGDCREDSERHWDLPDDAEVVYLDDEDSDNEDRYLHTGKSDCDCIGCTKDAM